MKNCRILVTGTRGIPGFQGGIETHCEELYPHLVKMGCSITLTRRIPYVRDRLSMYQGIKIINLFAPQSKRFEAIIHTILSTFYARIKGFRVIHIHGIGPSLCVPLARLLGLKVVMTHHGSDYKRRKWGLVSRFILRTGELFGIVFAHKLIVVSSHIVKRLKKMYQRSDLVYIPNGVKIHKKINKDDFLNKLGLKKDSYILSVGRFVPEKGFHDLIMAFSKRRPDILHLVIAGDADHITEYSRELKKMAVAAGCILTGFIHKDLLGQLYSHARLFVLPSYHEGLPLSLLEALSYGCDVLVSDIPAHKVIGLGVSSYFKTGDLVDLQEKVEGKLFHSDKKRNNDNLLAEYDWKNIAQTTYKVYADVF